MNNKVKRAIALILVLFGAWFYVTPYLAVHSMRSAAAARDAVKFSSYVNYSLLKEDLKGTFKAKFAHQAAQEQGASPFAAYGAAMALAFINPMVDALLTPDSLALLMSGDKFISNKAGGGPRTPSVDAAAKASGNDTDISLSYESFNRFVVSVKKKNAAADSAPVGLVLHREGLFFWKLSALRLSL